MLTDIEIAAQAKMKRITDVAAAMGIRPEELELTVIIKRSCPMIC